MGKRRHDHRTICLSEPTSSSNLLLRRKEGAKGHSVRSETIEMSLLVRMERRSNTTRLLMGQWGSKGRDGISIYHLLRHSHQSTTQSIDRWEGDTPVPSSISQHPTSACQSQIILGRRNAALLLIIPALSAIVLAEENETALDPVVEALLDAGFQPLTSSNNHSIVIRAEWERLFYLGEHAAIALTSPQHNSTANATHLTITIPLKEMQDQPSYFRLVGQALCIDKARIGDEESSCKNRAKRMPRPLRLAVDLIGVSGTVVEVRLQVEKRNGMEKGVFWP